MFGVLAGTLLVGAELVFDIYPPSAYAFCLSCHVRDLMNTIINAVFGSRFPAAEIAGRAVLLTSPGVVLGALAAAWLNREIAPRRSGQPVLAAALGFLVMTIGIVIFGCPTRIVLRAGYGEVYGVVALAGMLVGIVASTLLLRLWSRRERRDQ
jgi:hypothetical protein